MNQDEQFPMGGGAGGGGTGMDDHGNNLQSCKKTYQIAGNQVLLLSRKSLAIGKPKPEDIVPSRILLLAAGGLPTYADDGTIELRGTKGVRISSGGPSLPLLNPASSTSATSGVEIIVAETDSVKIQRGDLLGQSIKLTKKGITVDAGEMGELTLKCGENSIVINAMGITITGLLVEINPPAPMGPGDFPDPSGDSAWA